MEIDGIRVPECPKTGRFAINGVSLAPIEKTIAHGRPIVQFRTDVTVAAIRTAMAATRP